MIELLLVMDVWFVVSVPVRHLQRRNHPVLSGETTQRNHFEKQDSDTAGDFGCLETRPWRWRLFVARRVAVLVCTDCAETAVIATCEEGLALAVAAVDDVAARASVKTGLGSALVMASRHH